MTTPGSILGTRVLRTEDPLFLTHGGTYTDDVVDEALTGAENLNLVGRLNHLPRSERRQRARELLEQFGLIDRASQQLLDAANVGTFAVDSMAPPQALEGSLQRGLRGGFIHAALSANLGKVPNASQQSIGDARRSSGAAGQFARSICVN